MGAAGLESERAGRRAQRAGARRRPLAPGRYPRGQRPRDLRQASGRAPRSAPTPGAPSSARRPALHGTNFHPGTQHAVSGSPRHGRRHWSPEVGGRAARWRAEAAGSAAPDPGEQGDSSSWHLRVSELPGEPPVQVVWGWGSIDRTPGSGPTFFF